MPVYSLPAADVEAAVKQAIDSDETVRQARAALDRWHASPDGKAVDAAIASLRMTEDDALHQTLLGHFTRDAEAGAAKVRQRVELAFTVITPREVTAALRTMWPQCAMSSRNAGTNWIEVTLPGRPATDLLGNGDGYQHAEELLHRLLHMRVTVIRAEETPRSVGRTVRFLLEFPLPGR